MKPNIYSGIKRIVENILFPRHSLSKLCERVWSNSCIVFYQKGKRRETRRADRSLQTLALQTLYNQAQYAQLKDFQSQNFIIVFSQRVLQLFLASFPSILFRFVLFTNEKRVFGELRFAISKLNQQSDQTPVAEVYYFKVIVPTILAFFKELL